MTGTNWGSPGLGVVFRKEMADYVHGIRAWILLALVFLTGLSTVYVAALSIRSAVAAGGEDAFVFLRLFTAGGETLPPFTFFIAFLGPLAGLALGFDAINGERVRNTLSRLLAQPIHRDAVINAKFLAGIAWLAVTIGGMGLLVSGLGLRLIGVPPTFEEALRILLFLGLSVVYVAFWLALSILFSTLFRQAATAALAGIALWLFFALFADLLVGMVADGLAPVRDQGDVAQVLRHEQIVQGLGRLSPTRLYSEAAGALLSPEVRTLARVVLIERAQGAIPGALDLGQSLLLIWPHLTGLVAATLICFALAYIAFMRQEIRAG